jgi:hypothetical protein
MVPETGFVSGCSIMLDRKIYNLRLSRTFGLYLFLPVEAKSGARESLPGAISTFNLETPSVFVTEAQTNHA